MCDEIMLFAMGRPKPKPSVFLLIKGVNISSLNSQDMDSPLSWIEIIILSLLELQSTET